MQRRSEGLPGPTFRPYGRALSTRVFPLLPTAGRQKTPPCMAAHRTPCGQMRFSGNGIPDPAGLICSRPREHKTKQNRQINQKEPTAGVPPKAFVCFAFRLFYFCGTSRMSSWDMALIPSGALQETFMPWSCFVRLMATIGERVLSRSGYFTSMIGTFASSRRSSRSTEKTSFPR